MWGEVLRDTNRSLLLNRLVPWRDPRAGEQITGEERRRFLEACAHWPQGSEQERVRADALRRFERLLNWYRKEGWDIRRVVARPRWRFVSGLGISNPLEVNLVLHPVLGFPYIPGSSVKGAVRAYAEAQLEQEPKPPDAPSKDLHPDIARVFGARDRKGEVLFFDALPLDPPCLELDVINVHYPDYYRGKGESPPTDWQDPTPITFLTVGEKTRFLFALASQDGEAAGKAMGWLKGTLEETGLGGKVSAGYGLFTLVEGGSG